MLKDFRTYQLALALYDECSKVKLKGGLKDQMARASSSIVLNLAEGSAKSSRKERARFYQIALGSLREVQAILAITNNKIQMIDKVGGGIFRLIQNPGPDF